MNVLTLPELSLDAKMEESALIDLDLTSTIAIFLHARPTRMVTFFNKEKKTKDIIKK